MAQVPYFASLPLCAFRFRLTAPKDTNVPLAQSKTEEWVSVETGGLEKLNRRFAISLKNQLNPFASRKIAIISIFWICLFLPILRHL
jgi:hypothetical protein